MECAETQKERGRQNGVEVLVGRSERRDAQNKEHTDRERDCADTLAYSGQTSLGVLLGQPLISIVTWEKPRSLPKSVSSHSKRGKVHSPS